jgi:hypothetical protein
VHIILYLVSVVILSIDSNNNNNELLLIDIEKKVERCKIVEFFKDIRCKLIELKNLFSMRLLLSKAKL